MFEHLKKTANQVKGELESCSWTDLLILGLVIGLILGGIAGALASIEYGMFHVQSNIYWMAIAIHTVACLFLSYARFPAISMGLTAGCVAALTTTLAIGFSPTTGLNVALVTVASGTMATIGGWYIQSIGKEHPEESV